MFKRLSVLILFGFALAGCATPVTHNTASGRPEVTITGVTTDSVKGALITEMINHGFSITRETNFLISFDAPIENFWAGVAFGSRYDSQPNNRVTYTLAKIGENIRVVADIQVVTNPNSAFERLTSRNGSEDSLKVQEWLNTIRIQLEANSS